MINHDLIEQVLSKLEGPCQTIGYIPCYKGAGTRNYRGDTDPAGYTAMGASGVTIATGCDLGQTESAVLTGYGLDPDVVELYRPYFGLRKEKAIRALHNRPLRITMEQARATDRAVHDGYMRRYVIPAYEKDSAFSFASLPGEAQAVIMSLCFHKGCHGVRRDLPAVWQALTAGEWAAAGAILVAGGLPYASRRRYEGELLLGMGARR